MDALSYDRDSERTSVQEFESANSREFESAFFVSLFFLRSSCCRQMWVLNQRYFASEKAGPSLPARMDVFKGFSLYGSAFWIARDV